ncbi:LysR family transcriptional regulator [Granulibacter bethesdensis]|uniref:Transcriptional regulator, LysR family n=1 Tax=Granulibacter bethesdensis (strain ATCC BAA-1260 / CGDNIH1) TaxID=391165 RepID=Q0BQS4_GRABC|nr:LysR family transcriptional regulator [Granulibacter bethesdensis]ABI62828.1 Transcriptional regulator, LysR family [Granulibacter bethesdensis CGDNIH1]AHJ68219.1 Transcriptional regulator, LysR family [Granulibacter bethesdensis]APH52693.1 Transcriptional regulator, LysR family [Granulibacter bethesdensis]APH65382.1 Transcriptional regulator, LysR family [Granulibacter bethesdensis]
MIDKLEYLLALSREHHFGRAAETCGVTQPTLSAGLKQLEEQLGALLVQRGARFIGFTPEGERALDWARRITTDTKAMRQEIQALKYGLNGNLRLAVIPTAMPIVSTLTTPFRDRHPDVTFTIVSKSSIATLSLIENFEADAGISYLDNEPLGRVRAIPLYREHYCLVTAPHAPLGDREEVAWQDLSGLPLCLLTPDMQNRRILDRMLSSTGVEPKVSLESNSMIGLWSHVRTGAWASIMPARLVDILGLNPELRAIPIVGGPPAPTVGLVIPHRDPLTPLIAALFKEAEAIAAHLEQVTINQAGQ